MSEQSPAPSIASNLSLPSTPLAFSDDEDPFPITLEELDAIERNYERSLAGSVVASDNDRQESPISNEQNILDDSMPITVEELDAIEEEFAQSVASKENENLNVMDKTFIDTAKNDIQREIVVANEIFGAISSQSTICSQPAPAEVKQSSKRVRYPFEMSQRRINRAIRKRIPKALRKPVKPGPGESQESVQQRENMRLMLLESYDFNQVEYMDLDFTLIAPSGSYRPPEIPADAPKKFITARAYLEMSQKPKPLTEEVEINEILVCLQREHVFSQEEQELLVEDDEIENDMVMEEPNIENLNQSIHELTEKIDLNLSLASLSQKLDTSDRIIEYAEHAAKVSDNSLQDVLKIRALKEFKEKLRNRDLSFDTQEYENMIERQYTQVEEVKVYDNVEESPKVVTKTSQTAGTSKNLMPPTPPELTPAERAELGRKIYYDKLRALENEKIKREFEEFNRFKMTFSRKSNEPSTSTGGFTTENPVNLAVRQKAITNKRSPHFSSSDTSDDEMPIRKNTSRTGKHQDTNKTSEKAKNVDESKSKEITLKDISKNQTPMNSFAFASGKNLLISDTTAQMAKKKFDENSVDNTSKDQTAATTMNSFSFASGKNLQISESTVANAKKKFESSTTEKPTVSGFSFASGKNLQVSDKAAEAVKKKFEEETASKSLINKTAGTSVGGFSFASGKNLEISESTAANVKKKFNDETSAKAPANKISGFSFASGKNLQISDATALNAKRKFNEVEISDESIKENSPKKRQGFQFVSGKSVQVSDTTAAVARKKFQDASQNSSQKSVTRSSSSSFLSLRSGKKAKENDDPFSDESFNTSLNKSQNYMSLRSSKKMKVDDDPFSSLQPAKKSQTLDDPFSSPLPRKSQTRDDPFSSLLPTRKSQTLNDSFSSSLPPKIAKVNEVPFSEQINSIQKDELFKKPHLFAPPHASSPIVANSPNQARASFRTKKSTAMKSPIIPDNLFEVLDELNPDSRPKPKPKPKNQIDYSMYRMSNLKGKENQTSVSTPTSTTPVRQNVRKRPNRKMTDDGMTLSQRLRQFDALMAMDPEVSNSQYDQIYQIELIEMEKIKAEEIVNEKRRDEFRLLREYIENKPAAETKPMQGSLYMMKQDRNCKTLQEFIGDCEIKQKNVINIKYSEIIDHKFYIRNLISCEEDLFIMLGDNAQLVIGHNYNVGFEEIKVAFLSSPGVDPKLLHAKWIENAFQLISIKLIWMENSYEKVENVFTPENILLQLKYRYDREIDLSERPAIRRITELDDIPQRRMILKVHDIHFIADLGYELELSDGWYKIRTTVDKCIAQAIDDKIIQMHTKLIICGANLLNPSQQGHHPLDMPNTMKLKISGNSTRVADIDTTLGFCENPFPFQVPLDSISGEGGFAGKLKLYVTHVYALVYVASDGEKKSYRSEKMQHRIETKNEMIFSRLFSDVYEKTLTEYRMDIKSRVDELKNMKFEEYSVEDICEIFEYDLHDSYLCNSLWNKMNPLQKTQVEVYQNELKSKLREATLERMEMIEQNKVVSMIKFRVVDEEEPGVTAAVSWYQPPEDFVTLIKEGKVIELSGALVLPSTDEMYIYATNNVKFTVGEAESHEKYQKYLRNETKIGDIKRNEFKPPHDQFDTACLIIRIGDKMDKGYQPVFVVDEKKNFLEIKFVPSIAEHAYDNVLKVGMIFFIRDLYWCDTWCEKNESIPSSNAIADTTVFVMNPRKEVHRLRLEELRANIDETYKEECTELLEQLVPTKIILKIRPEDNPELAKRFIFRQYGKPCAARRFHF